MSNTALIGTLLCLALPAGLAACAGSAGAPASWQKAGATDATVANDTAQCRTSSQQTAARLYPLGSSNPTLGGAGMVAAQQQASTDRSSAELQFFNDCMEGRGYTRPKS
jgi:Flp pilus assembly protein TadD